MFSDQMTPGQQLFAIINSTTVTPYPVFTGCQQALYGELITAFNEALQADGLRTVTDLRTDVYPDPEYYLPTTVQGIIQNMQQPPIPAGCQVSDWTAVYDQISTEVAYLVQLYNFQTDLRLGTMAVNQAMAQSFVTAQNTINAASVSSSGFVSVINILSDIVNLGYLFDDISAITTIVGTFLACLTFIPGGDGVQGKLDQLQMQLAETMNQANTAAGDVYAPICTDWGKLQQFEVLLPALAGASTEQDYQTIGNLYEISVYQAVLPSIMAVVNFPYAPGHNWGCCADPDTSSQGLGYTPTSDLGGTFSDTVCSRLTALGVNLSDVCSRTGGWSGLALWNCVYTQQPDDPMSCTNQTPETDTNVVTVTGTQITNIAYVPGSLVVTAGQANSPDVEAALEAGSTDVWSITASANRSGSSDVASQFVNAVGGVGHAYCPSSSKTKTPGKLNFYFAVSITVGPVTVTPVYFGQGHTFIHNNWWIGGSAVTYGGSGSAYLAVGSGQFSISGGTSSFELSS
jgi:hypothetical protein